MSPIGTPVPGAFPLTSVARLPNVTVAYPGERWSDRKASGIVAPGTAVVPVASGGKLLMRAAQGGDAVTQMAVAMRTIDVPDINPGSIYQEALGPNEIRNLPIQNGDYILALYSGALVLSLINPDTYNPGDLIGWLVGGNQCTGKPTSAIPGSGVSGSWGKNSGAANFGGSVVGPLFEVTMFRPVNSAGTEGLLNVRSLRGQGPF
jgi:hypothetical protein